MTPFELATRDLLALIAECLDYAHGADDRSRHLISLVKIRAAGLASDLAIDEGYPDLPDAPLRDLRRDMDFMRGHLAAIKAGTEGDTS